MKKLLSILIPIAAGGFLVFLALPLYGGNLNIFVEKIAMDWEIPVVAIRILLSMAAALILTLVFQLFKRIALWLAILVVLGLIFAPALFSDVPIITEEVKTTIEQRLNS